MFPAVDDGDAVSEEVHFGLLESAIMSGMCALLVLQFIRFAEACTFRGCALEIVRKQAGDDAKQTAEDAAAQLKKAGAELKVQAEDAADKTKAAAHKAGDQARDSADNRSSS